MIGLDHLGAALADAVHDERIDVDQIGRGVDDARLRDRIAGDDQRHADGFLVERGLAP
jgi:hypothetical protein